MFTSYTGVTLARHLVRGFVGVSRRKLMQRRLETLSGVGTRHADEQTPSSRVLLENLVVAQLRKILFARCGTAASLPCSQNPITGRSLLSEKNPARVIAPACLGLFGAFAKIARSERFPHVCPSVRMEQLGSNWMDFHEI
jgi:hypothetical protein